MICLYKKTVCGDEHGIALLVVLWVLSLLIVSMLSFSILVRIEIFSTTTFTDQLENKYLAEAGLHRAVAEIFYRNAHKGDLVMFNGEALCRTDGTSYNGQMGDGHYQYAITDESGKININALTDVSAILLNNLLRNLGVEESRADTIVDSILDWKDADNLHRLHGAENEYYMSLPKPYKAKDGHFDNLEELLLVKGMDQDILYGTEDKPGVIKYLTVYSPVNLININSAPPEILKVIPFMTDYMIQSIIDYRKSDHTKKDGSGLQTILSANDYAKISPYITTTDSNIYSVEVIGLKKVDTGGYPIRSVLSVEKADHFRILYYQSPAYLEMVKNVSIQE